MTVSEADFSFPGKEITNSSDIYVLRFNFWLTIFLTLVWFALIHHIYKRVDGNSLIKKKLNFSLEIKISNRFFSKCKFVR